MFENLNQYTIVLGSQSPRRKQLLEGLGLAFNIAVAQGDESYPHNLIEGEVPLFLSKQKAKEIAQTLQGNFLLITSDTVVSIDGVILNKPQNEQEARAMLGKLSGKVHEVFTGVTLTTQHTSKSFVEKTRVQFKVLTTDEIDYYIQHYKPYDKAGSYGVQEWMGYIAITRIEGCFFNVMGLPLAKLYEELVKI